MAMTIPRPGDMAITRGGGLAMALVRFGTHSEYGHAAIVKEATSIRVCVIEATPHGVREKWYPLDHFKYSTGGPIELTEVQREIIVRTAQSYVGLPYDWPSIAAFVIRWLGAKHLSYSPSHPDKHLFCSELVVWAYLIAKVFLFPGRAPGDVAPADLEQFCPNA